MNNIEVNKYLSAANAYIKEMSRYNSELKLYSKKNINLAYTKYLMDKEQNVIHLYYEDEYAGFLIISTGTKCHPNADYHIMEAYVVPKYRNKGVMKQAITNRMVQYPGTYCMYMLKDNTKATKSLLHIFEAMGLAPEIVKDEFVRPYFDQYFVTIK